jgi:hypothetical protein
MIPPVGLRQRPISVSYRPRRALTNFLRDEADISPASCLIQIMNISDIGLLVFHILAQINGRDHCAQVSSSPPPTAGFGLAEAVKLALLVVEFHSNSGVVRGCVQSRHSMTHQLPSSIPILLLTHEARTAAFKCCTHVSRAHIRGVQHCRSAHIC